MGDLDIHIRNYKRRLAYLEARPWRPGKGGQERALTRRITALEEAQRDITNTSVTKRGSANPVADKNNYRTYSSQVEGAYRMYDGLSDYGGEVVSSVVDIRCAFIAGEGVSFYSKNKAKTEFVRAFLKRNKLNGSRLLSAVQMGELEGRALFVMAPAKGGEKVKGQVDARLLSWYATKYEVKRDARDYEALTSIKYRPDADKEAVDVPVDRSVYVKLGGCSHNSEDTPTKIGKVLTQCENASRAAYDLRKNTHLFGRVFPYWNTNDPAGATFINNALKDKSLEIGDGYAGPAKLGFIEPSGGAADAVIKDLLLAMRFIASMTGVPIHWLAWPELMSNRATAENLLEVVNAATKRERLVWQECLSELLEKAMMVAVNAGADAAIMKDDFDLRLPLISMASLQQLVDVWLPLWQDKLVSTFTLRNMIPGVDPEDEEEQVEAEKEEAAKDSPFANATGDAARAAAATARQGAAGQGGVPGQEGGAYGVT